VKVARRTRRDAGGRIATAVLLLLAVSCQSTKITDVWVPKDAHPEHYVRVMIVGLLPTPGLRAQYENDFVDKLSDAGVIAVASINLVPDVAQIDRKTVEDWVSKFRLDGVLVTRLVHLKRETEYIPPTYSLAGWYGRWAVPTSPGRMVEDTTVSLETDLFDAKNEKLVYSAVSKTYDPTARDEAIHSVLDALVGDMTKRGYLPAP